MCKKGDMAGEHDCLEGKLTGITQRKRMYGKRAVPCWHVDLVDTGDGEAYRIGLACASGVFMALTMNLGGSEGMESIGTGRPLRIEAYIKDGFTRLRAYDGSRRLSLRERGCRQCQRLTWAAKMSRTTRSAWPSSRTLRES